MKTLQWHVELTKLAILVWSEQGSDSYGLAFFTCNIDLAMKNSNGPETAQLKTLMLHTREGSRLLKGRRNEQTELEIK